MPSRDQGFGKGATKSRLVRLRGKGESSIDAGVRPQWLSTRRETEVAP